MVDWSYVAGLFDHKGNLNILNVKGKEYFQLRIYSSHKETLEEVKKFLECGNIYHKQLSKKNKNWSDQFELTITTKEDIYIVLTQILPFLVKRKVEVEKVLKQHKMFKNFSEVNKEASNELSNSNNSITIPGRTDIQMANNSETDVQTSDSEDNYVPYIG